MKKIFTIAAIALFGFCTTFAQKITVKQPKQVVATTQKDVSKTKTVAKGTVLKADGTPDMRYKENKKVATVVISPKKKDGTADMRFKANKPIAAKKKK